MNILDPAALIAALPDLLPASKKLASPQDGLSALFHTIMVAVGFRLIAVDDASPAQSDLANVLPLDWNKAGPSNYTLRYRHDQSSLEFVLKIAKLGPRTVLNAIALESDKATSLDISTSDFVSPSFYPSDLSASDAQPLVHGLISSNRVADLASQFKLKILQKLMPGLRKDGYTETNDQVVQETTAEPSASAPRRQPQFPRYDPDDEFPLRQPSYPQNPLSIGRRDLDPFPMSPFSPPALFPGGEGDGMFVGPGHPIFAGRRDPSGQRGPWGGDGFLPPMGAPPGARFDPVGPFPGPGRTLGPRGIRGGDPDNDEFMPPGAGDMFM
ncbi:PI31 proteasome regulator N-terminal-domain-containing protein [Mycena floridula]|nr:PI31 proteasome regulator N-terminal-domain-containing protein [Mycena floridula]